MDYGGFSVAHQCAIPTQHRTASDLGHKTRLGPLTGSWHGSWVADRESVSPTGSLRPPPVCPAYAAPLPLAYDPPRVRADSDFVKGLALACASHDSWDVTCNSLNRRVILRLESGLPSRTLDVGDLPEGAAGGFHSRTAADTTIQT